MKGGLRWTFEDFGMYCVRVFDRVLVMRCVFVVRPARGCPYDIPVGIHESVGAVEDISTLVSGANLVS